jgi:hypothetical protein
VTAGVSTGPPAAEVDTVVSLCRRLAEDALRDVIAALPGANPNHVFREAVRRIEFARY